MATLYISDASGNPITDQKDGAAFSLAAGTSQLFYCEPTLGIGENLTLQVSPDSGTSWVDVGELVTSSKRVGTVNAVGEGASYFRVNKSETATATQAFYD